jgi:heptosyltransferase I
MSSRSFDTPPASVCIPAPFRHRRYLPRAAVVRTLQRAWPDTRFTWIIGRVEAKLLGHIPDIEFIVLDKKSLAGSYRVLREQMRGPPFRRPHAHAAGVARQSAVDAGTGQDQARLRPQAGARAAMAVHEQPHPAHERQHVMDALFGFAEKYHVYEKLLRWDIPIPQAARDYARRVIPDDTRTLIISPCSSHRLRNWRAEYYAQIADYAISALGMRVVLCGGRSRSSSRWAMRSYGT